MGFAVYLDNENIYHRTDCPVAPKYIYGMVELYLVEEEELPQEAKSCPECEVSNVRS